MAIWRRGRPLLQIASSATASSQRQFLGVSQGHHSRTIRDYVPIIAVGAIVYTEPIFTQELDVIVLVDTDSEYLRVFRRLADFAEGREGMHYVFGGIPVQVFPSTTKPLYEDTLRGAETARVGNLRVKVASPEHLIVLALEAFRAKDKLRIQLLLPRASSERLYALLKRIDDEKGTLAKKLESLR